MTGAGLDHEEHVRAAQRDRAVGKKSHASIVLPAIAGTSSGRATAARRGRDPDRHPMSEQGAANRDHESCRPFPPDSGAANMYSVAGFYTFTAMVRAPSVIVV